MLIRFKKKRGDVKKYKLVRRDTRKRRLLAILERRRLHGNAPKTGAASRAAELFKHETYSGLPRSFNKADRVDRKRRKRNDGTGNAHLIPISALSSGAREDDLSLLCFSPPPPRSPVCGAIRLADDR